MTDTEWLLLIARSMTFPDPPPDQCYILYAEHEDNPDIDDDEAAAIRRRFDEGSAKFINV